MKPGADFTSVTGKQRKYLNVVDLTWNVAPRVSFCLQTSTDRSTQHPAGVQPPRPPPPEAEITVLVPLVICEVVLMPRSPPGLVSC